MYAERFQEFSGLISRAEKALQRAKAENVRGYGLRSVHVSCLLALYEHEEGLTGTELAAVCGVDFELPHTLGYTGLSDALLQKYVHDSAYLWTDHAESLPVCLIGSVIGTHGGPGAIAVAFFQKTL